MSDDDPDTVANTGDPNQIPQQDVMTGEYVNEGERSEFDQRIVDLGPAPGYAASAAESDRYNFAVADIEAERARAVAEGLGDEEVVVTEDTSGERPDVIILDPPDYAAVAAGNKSEGEKSPASRDDGAMGAATP